MKEQYPDADRKSGSTDSRVRINAELSESITGSIPKYVVRPEPAVLPPELLADLLKKQLISSDPENYRAVWFGEILLFSVAQRDCWQVLWDNLFRRNLPLPHTSIIRAWAGESTHMSNLYKRHRAWKRIIVGNGKGMFWLHIPEHILRKA